LSYPLPSQESLPLTLTAKFAIQSLLAGACDRLEFFPKPNIILHAQLTDILRKLKLPSQTVEHCEHALSASHGWGYDSGNDPRDRRAAAYLLDKCRMQSPDHHMQVAAYHKCSCCKVATGGICWRNCEPHDTALRLIFTWCAAYLLDDELNEKISEVVKDRSFSQPDGEIFVRQIGRVVFCHVWNIYDNAPVLAHQS
jgi:hypothetical protein